MVKFYTSFLLCITMVIGLQAQNTVGTISYDVNQAYDGYNLFFPHGQGNAFLINNCGEVVNKWEDPNFLPGNGVYLTEDGDIFMCKANGAASNPNIHAGGGGEKIEKRDWDNNLLWEFTHNSTEYRLHHDIALLPNGNVLAIAWEVRDSMEAVQAGRDPSKITESVIWPDKIIEVQVDGPNSGDIVWEWHAWDHLVQDFDPTKDNFGVVADHPEKINVNFDTSDGRADWLHANAIDYNATLDHIVLSVPTFSEVWIIDHSTTTAQAAGSTGGLSGRGGDLLYRWGNPQAYDNGTEADRKLFYQHDAHWVDLGLNGSDPDFGKIAVFNNRIGDNYSEVAMFNPPFVSYDWGYLMNGGVFEPADFDWTYTHPESVKMYSNILSSVQKLPNGNFLILAGRPGYAFEINANEDIVWEYINPHNSGNPVSQGDPSPSNLNLAFSFKRYAPDFAGFDGKDLTPDGYVELNPDTEFCDILIDVEDPKLFSDIEILPNPTADFIRLDLGDKAQDADWISIYDVVGNLVYEKVLTGDKVIEVSVDDWANGIYMVQLNNTFAAKVMVAR